VPTLGAILVAPPANVRCDIKMPGQRDRHDEGGGEEQ
jgi:hypothetical protein